MVQGGLFVCAGLIAIVAIVLARIPPTPAEGLEGYTLLWVLPPSTGQNTDARTARVGVQSSEFAPTQYRLQVQQAGNVLYEWQLKLQPGEQWESEALTIPNQLNELVKVLLVRSDCAFGHLSAGGLLAQQANSKPNSGSKMNRLFEPLLIHLRTPLFRNAYALILNEGLSAASGLLYWLVAARLYATDIVGRNAAAISTMAFLSAMAQLSLGGALMRFLPVAGKRSAKVYWRGVWGQRGAGRGGWQFVCAGQPHLVPRRQQLF